MLRRMGYGLAGAALITLLFAYAPGSANAACSAVGTAGDDVIVCDGTTPDKVFGLDGDDVITNNGTISSGGIDGGSGNDTITNNGFISASVDGGPGSDVILNLGTLAGGFGLDGGSGANTIYNDGSVDFIIAGGGGAGTVILGPNADGMAGINGDGDDTLCFNNGVDVAGLSAAGGSVTVGAETFTWSNFAALAVNCPVPGLATGDGRLNTDPLPPVVVWCRPAGVEVFSVNYATSEGALAFRASPAAVEQGIVTAQTTGANTAIASGDGATLYALTSGELQVNKFEPSGNLYVFIFDAGVCRAAFDTAGGLNMMTGETGGSTAPAVAPAVTAPTAPPAPGGDLTSGPQTTHVVQPGENLFRIALRYGLTWPELASINGIDNPDRIFVGQVLVIPAR